MASSSSSLQMKVELHIKCNNLTNMDLLSKSDPQCVAYVSTGPQQWREMGRTEVINDNLNPTFTKTFKMDYFFEKVQPLKFAIYDIDNAATLSLDDDDFIGSVQTTLAEICCSPAQTFTKQLISKQGKPAGTITIISEEVSTNEDDLILHLKGTKLAKKDFFGKSDPYFVLSKNTEQNNYLDVYKSEVIKVTLEPDWKPFRVTVGKLCNGDYHRPLKLSVYDWNMLSSHTLIGEVQTNLNELMTKNDNLVLTDPKKGKQKATGYVKINSRNIIKNYSFLEYLAGGLEISLIVSVDFTGSNGDPRQPTSLHYLGGQMNHYERAIRSVGDILSYYDHDKKFPAFGFGGLLPNKQVSHCFALNGNSNNPECVGVDGILQSYKQALYNVQLHGPTLFQPTIATAAAYASSSVSQTKQTYYILLIITDGAINDMQQTMQEIIRASKLPLSIVIVGVGNADFEAMNILDGDNQVLQVGSERAVRDIVQFVPFNQFASMDISALAQETLAEIPQQVCQYMKYKSIAPNKPVKQM